MKTIRNYLKEISLAVSGADYLTTKVLNECEVAAKNGAKSHTTSMNSCYAQGVVDYLVSVAKLDVYVSELGCQSILQISWGDE